VQAARLRDRLSRSQELRDVEAVYSSVLKRAVETAELVIPALSGRTEIVQRCDLCELHCGDADGMTVAQRDDQFGAHPGLLVDPSLPIAPNGESWLGLMDRASRALLSIRDRHPAGTVVLFTSNGVIAASMCAFGHVDPRVPITLPTRNTSLTSWAWDGDDAPLLEVYGDAAHLAGAP
jgi:probable phosphoglycerate mutase